MRSPRPHLKTAPTTLKKLDRVDTRPFSTKSALGVTSLRQPVKPARKQRTLIGTGTECIGREWTHFGHRERNLL